VIGRPVRIPYIMLCTHGERFCGKTWVANHRRDLPDRLAERRKHEEICAGGLIVAAKGPPYARDFGDLAAGLPLDLH
jgi:hypothetical protein